MSISRSDYWQSKKEAVIPPSLRDKLTKRKELLLADSNRSLSL